MQVETASGRHRGHLLLREQTGDYFVGYLIAEVDGLAVPPPPVFEVTPEAVPTLVFIPPPAFDPAKAP